MSQKITQNKKIATGLHILGDVYTKSKNLSSIVKVRKGISNIIKKNGLTELGSFYHQFHSGGFTGIVALTESHVALHTWPECGYLTLDVFVCNYTNKNDKVCKKVFDEINALFDPTRINVRAIKR